MTPSLVVTVSTIGLVGWILAALFAGLWWGERGRRLDAQVISRTRRQDFEPEVVRRSDWDPATKLLEKDEDEMFEKLVEDAMAEGYSKKRAEEDATQMIEQMRRMGAEDSY